MSDKENYRYLSVGSFDGSSLETLDIFLKFGDEKVVKGIVDVIQSVRREHGELAGSVYLDGFLQVMNYLFDVVGDGKGMFQGARIYAKDELWGICGAGAGLAMDLIAVIAQEKNALKRLKQIQSLVLRGERK